MTNSFKTIRPASDLIEHRRDGRTLSNFSFPEDLGTHAIILNFTKYGYGGQSAQFNQLLTASIALPIPNNLSESFNMRVNAQELGSTGAAVRDIVSSAGDGSLTTESAFKDIAGAFAGGAGRKAAAAFDAVAGTNAAKGLEIGVGSVMNPRIALSFDGMDLKSHTLSWTLAPQSENESDILSRIIKKIKRSILPSYTSNESKVLLNYPHVVDIFFLGVSGEHMYYFKRAMIGQFEVNYTGSGGGAFLEGGKPAVVTMTMTMTELDIHTAEDYTTNGDDNLGGKEGR